MGAFVGSFVGPSLSRTRAHPWACSHLDTHSHGTVRIGCAVSRSLSLSHVRAPVPALTHRHTRPQYCTYSRCAVCRSFSSRSRAQSCAHSHTDTHARGVARICWVVLRSFSLSPFLSLSLSLLFYLFLSLSFSISFSLSFSISFSLSHARTPLCALTHRHTCPTCCAYLLSRL